MVRMMINLVKSKSKVILRINSVRIIKTKHQFLMNKLSHLKFMKPLSNHLFLQIIIHTKIISKVRYLIYNKSKAQLNFLKVKIKHSPLCFLHNLLKIRVSRINRQSQDSSRESEGRLARRCLRVANITIKVINSALMMIKNNTKFLISVSFQNKLTKIRFK